MAQWLKNPLAMQETRVPFLDQEDPQRGAWQPISVFLLGKFHGQRSLAGHSPQAGTELDTTEMTEHKQCQNKEKLNFKKSYNRKHSTILQF